MAKPVLHLHRANSFFQRLQGLYGQVLAADTGLWLLPCRAVHTAAMPYAIDLVFLNRHRQIIRVVEQLPAWRLAFCWQAHSIIELRGGYLHRHSHYVQLISEALAVLDDNTADILSV